uniref:Cyclic nucleotide-binding domain-containing protein n=1 Tax=Mesocestoides corti TaxID=53468 RepID=A0A5K3ER17_MESCO
MSRSISPERFSDNTRFRKYSDFLLPRSISHSVGREHRKLYPFDVTCSSARSPRVTPDSVQFPLNPPASQSLGAEASPHQSERRPATDRLSSSNVNPWRKLRNALLVTSSAVSSIRRNRASRQSNSAFLDYFSPQKHPRENCYFHYTNDHQIVDQSTPNSGTENRFSFEGFTKLTEPSASPEEGEEIQQRSPSDSVSPFPEINKCDAESQSQVLIPGKSLNKSLQKTASSSQSVSIPLEEWSDLKVDGTSQGITSESRVKSRYLNHTRRFCSHLTRHFRHARSADSCYANASFERQRPFEQLKPVKFFCNPQGRFMFVWLGIVALATVYNFWTAIMRQAFHEIQHGRTALWISLDGIADLIYLADIMVQLRTSYLEKGLVVRDARKIATRYLWSRRFACDGLALLPFDLFQSITGIQPLLRFPRFLKCFRAWHWKVMVENRTTYPNAWRVLTLTHVLFLGCHWFASIYYMLSVSGHFKDPWGYPPPTTPELQSLLRKYLQSFYWATVTLTTIGDISEPSQTFQYAFTTLTYLIGVFVFATIVGQVGTIINNRNAARLSFETVLDNAKSYMSAHHVPQRLRNRVLRWYDYAWERRRIIGENDLNGLGSLPEKLKTELALHVHLETLKKVTIFHECRPEFLHDLVLKMRPYIFTPGDLICRQGEVAREMFIIADGVLEVIGKSGLVLKRLEAGDYFGEIGILCINGGGNKRTADVRAVGYAELFVLSREDVLGALADHPDAHTIIIEHATKRLLESKSREDAQVWSPFEVIFVLLDHVYSETNRSYS